MKYRLRARELGQNNWCIYTYSVYITIEFMFGNNMHTTPMCGYVEHTYKHTHCLYLSMYMHTHERKHDSCYYIEKTTNTKSIQTPNAWIYKNKLCLSLFLSMCVHLSLSLSLSLSLAHDLPRRCCGVPWRLWTGTNWVSAEMGDWL